VVDDVFFILYIGDDRLFLGIGGSRTKDKLCSRSARPQGVKTSDQLVPNGYRSGDQFGIGSVCGLT